MFPFSTNPMQPGGQQAPPQGQLPMAQQMPQQQMPQGAPGQSPWSQFQGGSAQPPGMPDPSQQMQGAAPQMPNDPWQRLLAEIRARQAQQQSPGGGANLQSMLGLR